MATGHCLCGQLELSTRGEPGWVSYCHCASCRRHTASPVTCFVNHKLADVDFTGELGRYPSSPGVLRSFCRSAPGG